MTQHVDNSHIVSEEMRLDSPLHPYVKKESRIQVGVLTTPPTDLVDAPEKGDKSTNPNTPIVSSTEMLTRLQAEQSGTSVDTTSGE